MSSGPSLQSSHSAIIAAPSVLWLSLIHIFLIGDDADVAADVKSTAADAERSEESRFDRLAELRKLFCIFVIMIDCLLYTSRCV